MLELNPDIFVSVVLPCQNDGDIIESVILDLRETLGRKSATFENRRDG